MASKSRQNYRLKAGGEVDDREGEGDDRGWDGWMTSPAQWTWVWASFGRWWRTGKPGMLQSRGSQRIGHDLATKNNSGKTEGHWYLCKLHWYLQGPSLGLIWIARDQWERCKEVNEVKQAGIKKQKNQHRNIFRDVWGSYRIENVSLTCWRFTWKEHRVHGCVPLGSSVLTSVCFSRSRGWAAA